MTNRDDVPTPWILDCEPVMGKTGPRVILRIEEGSRRAVLTPERAEALGHQLIEAAKKARQM
jgi:hypothetical protein